MPHIIKALDRKTFGSGIKVPAIHVFILRDEISWIIVPWKRLWGSGDGKCFGGEEGKD